MSIKVTTVCILLFVLCERTSGQSTSFTYQGSLTTGGNPASGMFDLRFTIYDSSGGGNLVAGPLTNSSTLINNGIFTSALDFGQVFAGAERWLEISVRPTGGGTFITLNPRQKFTSAPYAITASNVTGPVAAGQLIGSLPAGQLSGTIPFAQLPASVVTNGASGVNLTGALSGNAGGLTNVPSANLAGTIADTRLGGNIARLNLPGAGVQATATPVNISGFIVGANVVNGGSGYTAPPQVTVTDTSGSGAVITAQVFGGQVTGLVVSNAGSGYSLGATIVIGPPPNNANQIFTSINLFTHPSNQFVGTFAGNGIGLTNLQVANLAGTIPDARLGANIARLNAPGATVQATATPVVVSGFIVGASVVNGGSGYLISPAVTVNDGTGSGAVITAQISGGVVTNLTVSVAGSGYSSIATLTIAPPPNNMSQIFSSVNLFNNPSNQFIGTFIGNGSGLTNLNGANLVAGSVTAVRIASNSITSGQLAPGAAAVNLGASGQGIVPSGGMILSSNYNDANLLSLGYVRLANVDFGNVWEQRATNGAPSARSDHTAVWTGSELIVWGGGNGTVNFNDGGRHNPAVNSWNSLNTNGTPSARSGHTSVWTGSEMIIWGGSYGATNYNDGARHNPVANTWTAITTNGAPSARQQHTAVWTGSEMIVWGGIGAAGYLNDGARYNPVSNIWTSLSTGGAPLGRYFHTTVWTGNTMIVWGGFNSGGYLNDGGRYNPAANSWQGMTLSGAPVGRQWHTAVWTGNEMIVWGGWGNGEVQLNSGGRYNPTGNSWTAMNTSGGPSARYGHSVVWTGSEMIVWGGVYDGNTGARYLPGAENWASVTIVGSPSARRDHTAVWTGSEMIVWGGGVANYVNDTFSYKPSLALYLYQRP